jgi:hypothetical protein
VRHFALRRMACGSFCAPSDLASVEQLTQRFVFERSHPGRGGAPPENVRAAEASMAGAQASVPTLRQELLTAGSTSAAKRASAPPVGNWSTT